MKYLSKTFTVPVAGPAVTDEDWDAIWARKCPECGRPLVGDQAGDERCCRMEGEGEAVTK